MGLAEVLDVFRKFEVLSRSPGSVLLRMNREMESALTLAKSLPTSIRPSLVLVLKLLTSLRVVSRQPNTDNTRRSALRAYRHKSATRNAAPAMTMIRGDPVAFGILASVLHCVGSALRYLKRQLPES